MKLTYCSFADDDRCRGIVVLDGWLDPIAASVECHARGINPGGELMTIEVPEYLEQDAPDEWEFFLDNRNRLIDADEIKHRFGGKSLRELEAN